MVHTLQLQSPKQLRIHRHDHSRSAHGDRTDAHGQINSPPDEKESNGSRNAVSRTYEESGGAQSSQKAQRTVLTVPSMFPRSRKSQFRHAWHALKSEKGDRSLR